MQILLVSRSPAWQAAVEAATLQLGGSEVRACGPREALVEVASGDHFSHLLLEEGCADGLLDALADLTGAHASSRTSLVLLGGVQTPRPTPGVLRASDQSSIRQALTARGTLAAAAAGSPVEDAMSPADLQDAIHTTMMEARYQPIVRLADQAPVAFEALARLNHSSRGTLLPDQFVPQLEAAGLGRELTRAVSARVFSDYRSCAFAGTQIPVAVNFPLNVLTEPAALALMDEQRAAAGVPARSVVLELTESQPVEDLTELRRSLDWLRALGYGISIDDVGPAVPRARELLDLPFTGMKLDKDLVQQSAANPDTMASVQALVTAAKRRGLSVVAEGVRDQALWDLMLAAGVDYGQGFLIARPLPLVAIPVWLDAWQEGVAGSRQH